ncbi:MAG: histidine kinase [Desulfobacteraceae bacterium]|nr:MAG: histidine kinase [Desulfobacteraceae bacterium]
MNTLEELGKRLRELEEEINETKKRLPAHSVKPPVMMDLIALEDEYDSVLRRINELKEK